MRIALLLIFFLSFWNTAAQSQKVPAKPERYIPVHDYASLLSKDEFKELTQKLIKYEDSTATQIIFVSILSLNGMTIEEYSNQLFNNWGIGQKGAENGLLFVVAINERRMRFEVGYGLEPKLTDVFCARLIDNELTPRFRNKAFYAAFDTVSSLIIQKLGEEFKAVEVRVEPEPVVQSSEPESFFSRGEHIINSIFGLFCLFIYHFLTFLRFRKKKKLYQVLWHIFGQLPIIAYVAASIDFDPEPPHIIAYLLVTGVCLLIMFLFSMLKITNKGGWHYLIYLPIFIITGIVAFAIAGRDKELILPFWVFFFLLISSLVWVFFSPTKSRGGSSGTTYRYMRKNSGYSDSSRSSYSDYSDSYSDYRDYSDYSDYSDSSSSSMGGGSSGGGGASGSW